LKTDGATIVWQKLSKRSFFYQKFPLTNVEDSTNVQFVVINPGCREEDPLLKVFIENSLAKHLFLHKIYQHNTTVILVKLHL